MLSTDELLNLDLSELAERLVAAAHQARCIADGDEVLQLGDLLASVQTAADEATGPRLALLEVAEAFLRALSRSDLGRAELALRRFAVSQVDGGSDILGPLAEGRTIDSATFTALGEQGQALLEVGAIRPLPRDRYDLRPSLRSLARDLAEPAVFRAWRRVNATRAQVAMAGMSSEQAAACLAGEFGITLKQGATHLQRWPLTEEPMSRHTIVQPQGPGSGYRVVYSRQSTSPDEPVPFTTTSARAKSGAAASSFATSLLHQFCADWATRPSRSEPPNYVPPGLVTDRAQQEGPTHNLTLSDSSAPVQAHAEASEN